MLKMLRDDQTETIVKLRSAVAEGERRICIQAPTGWGKTLFSASMVEKAREKKKRLIFTVPAVSLVDQTVEMFYHQGIYDVGVIQAHHEMTDWSKPVQIASVQTLMKRNIPDADIVLIDECHRWFTLNAGFKCQSGRISRSSGCRPHHGRKGLVATTIG